jgi:hypothetical protein
LGFLVAPPPSGSWGDALIKFLRTRTDGNAPRVLKIKGAIVDVGKVELSIVGAFIQQLHSDSKDRFEKILHIFMGVLIEDFIASITGVGTPTKKNPVTVFYDTALLMRQLGCSGKLLQIATDELTRYLQDFGFNISFLSGNETEVGGILDTILYLKDTGKELEGETAAAMAAGEVAASTLRSLQNSLPERLAKSNIFPANELEQNAIANAAYQINELGFAESLSRLLKKDFEGP